MGFAFQKLDGLASAALLAAIEPVLQDNGVSGVELIWHREAGERVLRVTVERPGTSEPGAGVGLDECATLSRGIAAHLDEAPELVPGAYRLEVGTPGVERRLYSAADCSRFGGQLARIRCREDVEGNRTLRGRLLSVEAEETVSLETDFGTVELPWASVESAQLVLELSGSRGRRPVRKSSVSEDAKEAADG